MPSHGPVTGSLFRKKSRLLLNQTFQSDDATAASVSASSLAIRTSAATGRSSSSFNLRQRSLSLGLRRPSDYSFDDLAYAHQADKRSVSSPSTGPNAEHALDTLFRPPASSGDVRPSRTPSVTQSLRREDSITSQPSNDGSYFSAANASHNPRAVYHHIQGMASKRMSTLDYLRKA